MKNLIIDGKTVFFVRADGTLAEHSVGMGGTDESGEVMFFEIVDLIRPILGGQAKYQRIAIRRVFPCIDEEIREESCDG